MKLFCGNAAFKRYLFSQTAPSQMFDWVLNTPLDMLCYLNFYASRCDVLKVFVRFFILSNQALYFLLGFPFHLCQLFPIKKNNFSKDFLFRFCLDKKRVNGLQRIGSRNKKIFSTFCRCSKQSVALCSLILVIFRREWEG